MIRAWDSHLVIISNGVLSWILMISLINEVFYVIKFLESLKQKNDNNYKCKFSSFKSYIYSKWFLRDFPNTIPSIYWFWKIFENKSYFRLFLLSTICNNCAYSSTVKQHSQFSQGHLVWTIRNNQGRTYSAFKVKFSLSYIILCPVVVRSRS